MFACGTGFCDLATTSCLASLTGGQLRRVPGFKRAVSSASAIAASGGPPSAAGGVITATMHEEGVDKRTHDEIMRSQAEASDSLCTQVRRIQCDCRMW